MDREDIHEFISRIRQSLIKVLQEDIIEHLFIGGYFTTDEFNYIISHETLEKKIACFLDYLPSKTQKAFASFMDYLQEWYGWIFSEYETDILNENSYENIVERILSLAGVPSLPLKHVSRKDELNELINYLHTMQRGEYVVVHGMGGCGKSTLINEALRRSPSLVLDTFKEKIFWLKVGRESAIKKEALNEAKVKELTIQQELYMKLFTPGGYSSPPLPLDNDEGKRRLKEKLSESDLENCLLVLDEVPSSNFIECLNIGCKILVTTDNKNIMDPIKNYTKIHFLKVSEGFTENETIKLFLKNLRCDELPSQARLIHALCKGFPLTVSLVASQLADYRDDVLTNNDRWDMYVRHLTNKNIEAAIGRCDQYRQDQVTSLYNALAMSINNLTLELQEFYQDFALFMDDVNIKPEVLSTLWKVSKNEVEDIMNALETKCLVIRTWNRQLSSYVYCVHDLLLDYLKRRLTLIELQALHQKLIARYREAFGNDFVNFSRTDNYIFLYLGYHLKEAGYLEEFPKLYFNLTFIETKILIHGAADVLYDFKKYKDYITNTEVNFKIYEELYNFVSRIGICRILSSSDIVQFALAEPKGSYVYKMGIEMAKNSNKKYFEYLTEVPKDCSSPDVHPIRGEKITAAIFTPAGDIILANANNLIKVINIETHSTILTLEGHREKINHLVLSPLNILFLSASECSVKIWSLNSIGGNSGSTSDKPRTPSPSLNQKAWTDIWAQQRIAADKPVKTLEKHGLPITDAQFSPKGFRVVTAGKDKRIFVWKMTPMNIKSEFTLTLTGTIEIQVDEVIVSCRLTPDETQVVGAAQNSSVWIYNVSNGAVATYFHVDFIINSIALIPAPSNFEIIVLGENYKALYEVSNNTAIRRSKSQQYSTLSRRRQDECICAAVSNDGKYIAFAPTFYCIVVKEVKTDAEVAKFHETNGKISGISWSHDCNFIMTTYESALFKVWHLPKSPDDRIVKLKASVFDAAWIIDEEDKDNPDDRLLVTAVLDTEYNINIYHDLQLHKKISKHIPDSDDICQLCVCPVNGHVIYACKDGTVAYVEFDDLSSCHLVDRISCYKVLKLKVFSNGDTTAVLLLVEDAPKLFKLVGWYNDQSSGDSKYLGNKVFYLKDESIIDFDVDLMQTNHVYVAKRDHTYHIYELKTATDCGRKCGSEGSSEEEDDSTEYTAAKFADFSPSFRFMCSGNDSLLLVTKMRNNTNCDMKIGDEKPTVCKFSPDEKYIAVGFASGLVRVSSIYDTVAKNDMEFKNISAVFDLMWSSQNNRLLVILDREIALFHVSADGFRPISIIYLSVDKVVINDSFSQIATVDNGGHFHVLKSPM